MPTSEERSDFGQKVRMLQAFAMELLYHPAMPPHFTDTEELHADQAILRFRPNSATWQIAVDERVAPLIGELWRMGYHTLASCESYRDGLAYVQFPALGWGAKALADAVTALGGDPLLAPIENEIGFNFTDAHGKYGSLHFNGFTVRFDPALIEPIAGMLKRRSDEAQRPNYEIEPAPQERTHS